MNGAHLHLLINHLPVFWLPVVVVLLVLALLFRDQRLARIGLAAAVVVAVGTVVVLLTGEPAVHALGRPPEISRETVHAHEDAATLASWLTIGVGVLAAGALVLFRKKEVPRWTLGAAAALVIACLGVMAWGSYLGGQIRHPEARSDWTTPASPPR